MYSVIRSFTQTASSEEDNEEWRPPEPKPKALSNVARDSSSGELKAVKRTAKSKEPKAPKKPKAPRLSKDPKPKAPHKPATTRQTKTVKALKTCAESGLARTKMEKHDAGQKNNIAEENKEEKPHDCPEAEFDIEFGPSIRTKEEVRLMANKIRRH